MFWNQIVFSRKCIFDFFWMEPLLCVRLQASAILYVGYQCWQLDHAWYKFFSSKWSHLKCFIPLCSSLLFLSTGFCCSWCWVPLCKLTPCWDLVLKSHLSHWNNMGSSSSAWTGRSSKHRGKAATETEIEIVLWIRIEQSTYGLAVRLWVDVRTLYVFVIPLSFNGTRSILC